MHVYRIPVALTALIMLAGTSVCDAQLKKLDRPNDFVLLQRVQVGKAPTSVAQSDVYEAELKQFMTIRIGNMTRACKLTPAQERRLTVASKGAIGRALNKWQKATPTGTLAHNGVLLFDNLNADVDIVLRHNVQKIQRRLLGVPRGNGVIVWNEVMQRRNGRASGIPSGNTVLQESIWKRTCDKVLTDQQKANWKSAEARLRPNLRLETIRTSTLQLRLGR